MVYISGEEMSHYTMQLILEKWVDPFVDRSQWNYFDLSCKARDDTDDQVLHDAVTAGAEVGAIFKEPTITPSAEQRKAFGLKRTFGSPNGAMRRGWNGITISRDTIHIPGIELGFKKIVLCERQAVGGEYGAGWKTVGKGRVLTTFFPEDMVANKPVIIDGRELTDAKSKIVVYDNPLDGVPDMAHIFFQRCLKHNVKPYVVTKKTVFKWQEGFWKAMKSVFDEHYKEQFLAAGLLDDDGELNHMISDAATMQIIRWTEGGFGMACHNYDGDMLTDEVAQVHRSPGFINSVLVGKRADGALIKEFEASHGTVADLWHAHLRGEETSMNPLGMAVALLGAMDHAATLDTTNQRAVNKFTAACQEAMYSAFREGQGTRDMSGPSGLTTEGFVGAVRDRLEDLMAGKKPAVRVPPEIVKPSRRFRKNYRVDDAKVKELFDRFDKDSDGKIDLEEFREMMVDLGMAPQTEEGAEFEERQDEQRARSENPLPASLLPDEAA